MYPSSFKFIQINELVEEFNNSTLNVPKILKLFKELFENLVTETTSLACVEIDNFCTYLYTKKEYYSIPDSLREIIFKCITLHDYPSEYAIASPQEILNEVKELYNELEVDKLNIKTKKDEIIIMFKNGIKSTEIAKSLGIKTYMVERVLLFSKLISGYSPNAHEHPIM